MRYEGILVRGIRLKEESEAGGNGQQGQFLGEQAEEYYASPIFLFTYMLVSNERISRWSGGNWPVVRQYLGVFEHSIYCNSKYLAFWGIEEEYPARYLTGMQIALQQGDEHAYWKLMECLQYTWQELDERMKTGTAITAEQRKALMMTQDTELKRAGILLLMDVLAEYYHVSVERDTSEAMLAKILWSGLCQYRSFPQKNTAANPPTVSESLDTVLRQLGVREIIWQSREPVPAQLPEYREKLYAWEWEKLWETIWQMASYIASCKKKRGEKLEELLKSGK